MILSEAVQIESFLYRELQKHFDPKEVKIKERIRLIPDLYKYKLEDPLFWNQAKGRIPQHYSLYFDNEFVCDFDSSFLPDAILLKFWRGLTPLYEQRKIYFDKTLYKAEDEIVKHETKRAKQKKRADLKKKVAKLKASPEDKYTVEKTLTDLKNDETSH